MPTLSVNTVAADKTPTVADIIARSFTTSVVSSFLFRTPESTWPPDNVPYELIRCHFDEVVSKKAQLGATIVEAGGFAAVAIWFPPDRQEHAKDDKESSAHQSMREQAFAQKLDKVKARCLQGRKHWYLNLIGRDPERKEKGVVRALIQPFLQRAREDGVPAWLEAVDEHSRDVYGHFGFRTVEEFRVGAGEFNARGEMEDGGEGVALYAMIYE
ncbi:uncharacterized protein DSM5745_00963 [Aspergillus mulundensis]|uniref:N-acetyltransferase domain-containing protein n=1 Tax=Aspergillus mulundensis TaxID=1810919 RepID=A0A3D8T5D1_9EURO|nr:hypothetical protein DSM5745_00963 [Aspergillus mulundensis]RDW93641.1 hypothetical protein DSM5745_00963 [Aspergillus mulundensis]